MGDLQGKPPSHDTSLAAMKRGRGKRVGVHLAAATQAWEGPGLSYSSKLFFLPLPSPLPARHTQLIEGNDWTLFYAGVLTGANLHSWSDDAWFSWLRLTALVIYSKVWKSITILACSFFHCLQWPSTFGSMSITRGSCPASLAMILRLGSTDHATGRNPVPGFGLRFPIVPTPSPYSPVSFCSYMAYRSLHSFQG